ncbi:MULTISPECIES: L,D-transpeptidase family protein [Mesorhizobium]|uniref:Murein L,D-transpeptidase n=6 Tax=Mesorhizobium TaxID=68287 RepID=A0AB38T5T9_9HYPH|nr:MULTISPECIES: murein L,D-transpeptidase [Mesorhizobium]MDF3216185.1 murein L,D-transpeptidase [Mesorhizobium ciceri]RUY71938.1 murein L,D-transpeptidase [Mesorhizobium sp. M7A.F.Ca.CA.001.05.1.1]RUZ05803.1 murein L,D-transpeptidase [Mesorhizobium sp. M7A.F.Ca.CA.001.04.2.1]RUZ34472.1 murein L,D-transpeptidase [Mesorhizobium sp. M7A.F.Ca.CA.001.04.1.1]RUZ38110.1 murein L,D-transpeptidase [Mesorhizobium sp. M7A.F.Ca.CA.001.15.1.1]
MKFLGNKATVMPLMAITATLAFGVPQAGAQGLFDMLFGGGVRHAPKGEFPPPPPKNKPKPKVSGGGGGKVKISSPSYYTYKADRLVRVDFSALAATPAPATPQDAAFVPSATGAAFRDAVASLGDYELLAEPDIAKALIEYYSANPDFIWISGISLNSRAQDAVRVLGEASSYGLTPADYTVEVPAAGASSTDANAQLKELVRFEMALSARVLRYAHDAQNGRVDPNRMTGYYDFPAKPLDLQGVLKTLAHTQQVRTYLESRHPQNAEYQALRVELEALQASAENEIVVDPKLLLKPGETSPELPKLLTLIARNLDDEMGGAYGEVLSRLATSDVYDPELVPVIKAVQQKAGMKGDGVIGPRTVATLAGTSKADKLLKVEVALEELRWLPSDLGSPRVFINQPAFTASYIDNGEEKLKTRAVIGRTTNQTSFFYDQIKQVDFHPYWGVPQSIIVNEMLPRLRNDPGYLDRSGYEVTDSRGKRIPSSAVNWGAYGSNIPYSVRQQPSEANALGELKILFPNKHAIYMHDTPQKSFFQRDMRALSHGCVRLQDPRGMAAAVLGTSVDYIAEKLKHGHATENVTRTIPVYVAYFTAWPDLSGKVEYFGDVYDRDSRLKQALDATEAVRSPSS